MTAFGRRLVQRHVAAMLGKQPWQAKIIDVSQPMVDVNECLGHDGHSKRWTETRWRMQFASLSMFSSRNTGNGIGVQRESKSKSKTFVTRVKESGAGPSETDARQA